MNEESVRSRFEDRIAARIDVRRVTVAFERTDGARIGINQVTKLPALPRLEFLVLTEPYVHSGNSEGLDKQIHPGSLCWSAGSGSCW